MTPRALALLAPSALLAGAVLAACAGKSVPDKSPAPPVDDVPKSVTSIVNATAIVSKCPDDNLMNSKAAQRAIQKLVEPCASVPGGQAHFSATLKPGGRIELGAPDGNPAEGVVPTCVLQNRLNHKVLLGSPCMFDVTLEERKIPAAGGGATDAGPG